MRATILIVDDEPDLLDMIRYNLERARFRVHTANDGPKALRLAASINPDLIILDVMMPDMDGVEACRRLRMVSGLDRVPILMLTALTDESDEIRGLEAGADDFVTKPVSPRLLLSRIRALLRRSQSGAVSSLPEVVKIHDLVVDSHRYVVEQHGGQGVRRLTLPKKQFQLLHFMAAHAGRAFSREDLLKAVWEDDVQVVTRTVDVHIRRLRAKIGESYIETVTGVGYRFMEKAG